MHSLFLVDFVNDEITKNKLCVKLGSLYTMNTGF